MMDVVSTAIVCSTVLLICAMGFRLIKAYFSGKLHGDISRLEEDINGQAEDLQKARANLALEITTIRERLGKVELANVNRRHS